MTPQDPAAKASRGYVLEIASLARAIRYARHEIDAAERDAEAERADPRLIDLANEIGHARTHLALAARKAAEIMAAPNAAERDEP